MPAKLKNNASSLLASAISESSTSLSVTPGDGAKFPELAAGEWSVITATKLVGSVAQREIMKVTGRAADVFTVVRAQEGTTALTFSAGDIIDCRMTAGAFDTKLDKDGGTVTGPIVMSDKEVSQAVLKDHGIAYKDSLAVNTLDYRNGSHQRWAPGTGAQALAITNWPPDGVHGELLIEGVNLGAATITGPTVKWLKPDGTFASTTSFNTNHGATLQAAGIDFILLWTRDAGVTLYGKVLR